MFYLIAILHLLFCLGLIAFVLLQDPKGGGSSGVFSGAGANQLFGTTGAANLLTKMTSWCAVLFGITCITMTILSRQSTSSVIDTNLGAPSAPLSIPANNAPVNSAPAKTEAPKAPEKK
jgi:preprotein translocase subunit SecG